ncbi:non-canonical purine NTP pyrophosphatase [Botrimarina hoheduenensis]|uniref:dITP/XTP pyrophosphatase n=1 Tax=Botrimarina hoheduenensis TaxID=2528000 RepID=A0A5C5W9H0_9BACT|nr:non-canonical purine NTP pyrophosphatase [Botrimarina hoheduenensis]TWT47310.1 Non-canonical purine NTP pyrophosphatase [Botrimarina hoheduenensis]
MSKPRLVIGSHNRKKRDELLALLAPHGIPVVTLAEVDSNLPPAVEDGQTFEENAAKKATHYARALGEWVMADDSGLCVEALRGAPGVDSALYAGQHGDDEANNALLIENLAGVSAEKRAAHYVAVLVLADPLGAVAAVTRGECHGRIVAQRRGSNGFGYDPLFEVREYHRTFGQLGPAVKRALSHRSRAMRQMLSRVITLLGDGSAA